MSETIAAEPGTADVEPPKLRRFGTSTATFVVIASMVGTGVLTTSGYTIYYGGSNQLMLWLWLIGGIVALCGALSVAELAAALPRNGGDYVFLYEAYGPLLAFLSGWVSFLIGFGAPIASSAFAASKYLLSPLDLPEGTSILAQKSLATVTILIFALAHTAGHKRSIQVQSSTTLIKLGILGALAAVGVAVGWGRWQNLNDLPSMGASEIESAAFSLVFIAYAFTGWNGAAYIAGEIDQPQRRLPRAIFMGMAIVVILYAALNLFYALALPADTVKALVEDPANTLENRADIVAPIAEIAARQLFGSRISTPLSVAIGLTLLASLSAFVLTGPRVAHAMAVAGQFPSIAGRLTASGTPGAATAMQVAWALVLLWSGSFENIVIYAGVGLSLFTMLTVAAVYVLRWRQPDLARPFRTPGYPFTPAIFLIVTAALTYAAFKQRQEVSLLALGSILAGIPVYYVNQRLRRRAA